MDFTIVSKPLDEITKAERRRLNYLTLRSYSLMRDDVLHAKENLDQFQLFLACTNKIIGWCVIFPGKLSTDVYEENDSHYIYTYVQRLYRRKGIGKSLVTRASEWAQKEGNISEVFAWNEMSESFFGVCQENVPIEMVVEYAQ